MAVTNRISHPRTLTSAKRLCDALNAMRMDGKTTFSVAEVGRYSEKAGGPKAQSIRNQNGSLFRELITEFASVTGQNTVKVKRRPLDNIDRALDDVRDLGKRSIEVHI